MRRKFLPSLLASLGLLWPQTSAVITNLAGAPWTHEKNDPPGAESVFLREDPKTGGMDLLVRFPAGHVIAPHWHSVNERIVLVEGRLSLRRDDGEKFLDPGGSVFLPAREVQRISCTSSTHCTFYIFWDGKLDTHAAR